MRYSLLLFAACLSLGCATQPEMFRPGERVNATSPEGFLAAEYPIEDERGPIGEVKVWSDGAERRDGVTVIHVAFEIENFSDEPLLFDEGALALDSATLDRGIVRGVAPAVVEGARSIAPQSAANVGALFVMPEGVRPQEVDAFRVHWRVSGAAELAQITPFFEEEEQRMAAGPYYWDSPFFDPFFYEPFYWSTFGVAGGLL